MTRFRRTAFSNVALYIKSAVAGMIVLAMSVAGSGCATGGAECCNGGAGPTGGRSGTGEQRIAEGVPISINFSNPTTTNGISTYTATVTLSLQASAGAEFWVEHFVYSEDSDGNLNYTEGMTGFVDISDDVIVLDSATTPSDPGDPNSPHTFNFTITVLPHAGQVADPHLLIIVGRTAPGGYVWNTLDI